MSEIAPPQEAPAQKKESPFASYFNTKPKDTVDPKRFFREVGYDQDKSLYFTYLVLTDEQFQGAQSPTDIANWLPAPGKDVAKAKRAKATNRYTVTKGMYTDMVKLMTPARMKELRVLLPTDELKSLLAQEAYWLAAIGTDQSIKNKQYELPYPTKLSSLGLQTPDPEALPYGLVAHMLMARQPPLRDEAHRRIEEYQREAEALLQASPHAEAAGQITRLMDDFRRVPGKAEGTLQTATPLTWVGLRNEHTRLIELMRAPVNSPSSR